MTQTELSRDGSEIDEVLQEGGCLEGLNASEIRTLLAYKLWQDGMEWPDVQDVLESRNPIYKARYDMVPVLRDTFGYKEYV